MGRQPGGSHRRPDGGRQISRRASSAAVTRITRSSRTDSATTCDLNGPITDADDMARLKTGKTSTTMQIPGVHIETLHNPVRYTYAQIEKACAIAQMLNRGKLVLVEPPRR
jgi:hypothetical protein